MNKRLLSLAVVLLPVAARAARCPLPADAKAGLEYIAQFVEQHGDPSDYGFQTAVAPGAKAVSFCQSGPAGDASFEAVRAVGAGAPAAAAPAPASAPAAPAAPAASGGAASAPAPAATAPAPAGAPPAPAASAEPEVIVALVWTDRDIRYEAKLPQGELSFVNGQAPDQGARDRWARMVDYFYQSLHARSAACEITPR